MESNPIASSPQPPHISSLVSSALSKTTPVAKSPNNAYYRHSICQKQLWSIRTMHTILDSVSQINFVTSRFANQLQLKSHRSSISIPSLAPNKSDYIFAQSSNANYSASVATAVTQLVTDYHPHLDLKTSDWKIPESLELAEYLFYKSKLIDLLIGATLFFELLCIGQICLGNHLPVLQKTRLDRIISGCLKVGASTRSSLVSSVQEPSRSRTQSRYRRRKLYASSYFNNSTLGWNLVNTRFYFLPKLVTTSSWKFVRSFGFIHSKLN